MTTPSRRARPGPLRHAGFLVAIALVACGAPAPSQTATSVPAPAFTGAPQSPLSPEDQAAAYRAIERQVEAIRGLAPKRPVDPVLLDEAGLRVELQLHSAQDNPQPAETARRERLLTALGVLPADADLSAIMDAFRAGQIAGFYQPRDGHLYVVSRSGAIGGTELTTFAHEYTHALQDQNFGLLQQADSAPSGALNGDRDLARLALIEGDATLVMTYWAQDHLTLPQLLDLLRSSLAPAQQAALAGMPAYFREMVLFPYQAGLQLAKGLQSRGGWAAVNAAFDSPPDSTEQVLHPERLATRDPPLTVTLPPDLAARMGSGWAVDSEDTLGEFQIRAWLAAVGSPGAPSPPGPGSPEAAVAAEGWGGDRVALLRGPDDAWALVLRTTWDTDQDALEFAAAAAAAVTVNGRYGSVAESRASRERWLVMASSSELVADAERAATRP